MSNTAFNKFCVLAMIGSLPSIVGCAHINVHQLAYETLRQADCRRNELEDFCSRNFAREFHEYDLMRRNFMRSQTEHTWRVNLEEDTLLQTSSAN